METSAELAFPRGPMSVGELDLLARTHASRLASFVRRRIGNPHDVEDLVQDTLLEAVRCIDQFQGQSRPETWLFGIALNLTRNYYKRARVRDVFTDVDLDEVAGDRSHDPAEIAEHRERAFRVVSAVEKLPSDSHRLLNLILDDDLSYEEAAVKFGIPTGTVRSRVSRARSFLRRHADASLHPPVGRSVSP